MLKKFYSAVLPSAGNYTLFMLGSAKHVWANNIDRLVALTEDRSEQQGVYFATASYTEATKRTQDNVAFLRALRLDIDAGDKKFAKHPDGAYPTQRDALAAFVEFTKTTKIRPSYIISSGEGLHIYYCLDEDLPPSSWLPLATRLGELCKEHGLRADSTVTTDTARILRPIGTLHPNGSRVSVLANYEVTYSQVKLQGILGSSAAPILTQRKYANTSVNDDVIGVIEGPPKSVVKIVANCAAMAEVAAVKGDVPEPFWRAMLGIVKFTVEGLDMAHEMSSGYPGYDSNETDKKYNAWAVGPSSCAEFSKHTTACAKCPHHGKIKSPISLGYMTEKQIEELPAELQPAPAKPAAPTGDPWDGCMPPNFSVLKGPNGQLTLLHATTVEKKDALGDMVKVPVVIKVTHSVFWLTHWIESEHADDKAQAMLCRYDPLTRRVQPPVPMDQSIIPNRMKLLEFLAKQSIQLISTKAANSMDELLKAQLLRIQMMSRRPKIADRFGLRILQDGSLVSAHGKYVINPDGTIIEGMLTDVLRSEQGRFPISSLPDNNQGEWPATCWADYILPAARKHAAFFRTHYSDVETRKYQLAIMLGIASPLMAFATGSYHSGTALPANGLSVSLLSSRAGRGKTSLVQAIMLAYGNPSVLAPDQSDDGATDKARLNTPSLHGTMPCAMDEMSDIKEAAASSMVSAVANGASKVRLTQTGVAKKSSSFSLVNLITTNRSIRDMIAAAGRSTDAKQSRMLELNVNSVVFDRTHVRAWGEDWAEIQRDCGGALGAVMQRAICQHGVARMNASVTKAVAIASEYLNAPQEARFQYRALGVLLVAQQLLKNEGLDMFDLKGMMEEFKDAFNAGAGYTNENTLPTNGTELMQLMLSDLKNRTLITETETHRGLDKTKFDVPLNARIPDVVLARHITSRGHTYIAGTAVREWCTENKVSERDIVAECKATGVLMAPFPTKPAAYSIQIDLFKGTKEANAVIARCYKVDTAKLHALLGGTDSHAPDLTNVLVMASKPNATPPEELAQSQENV